LGDAGNAALNLGLTAFGLVPVAGVAADGSKFAKGIVKFASKLEKLAPLFQAAGAYYAVPSIANVVKGEYTTEDLQNVANGLWAVLGVYRNKKSHKTARKYGTKNKSDIKSLDNVLDALETPKKTKIKKELVDSAIQTNPSLKQYTDDKGVTTTVEWIDSATGNVKDGFYEKA
jgi:hypothetical protein